MSELLQLWPALLILACPALVALTVPLWLPRCRTYVAISHHEGSLPHNLPPMQYWHLCRYCGKTKAEHT
jgi:hypothetical protein